MPKLSKQAAYEDKPARPTMRQVREDFENLFRAARFEPGYAVFFMDTVCRPFRPEFESPRQFREGGWTEPYRDRIYQCATTYIRMSETDRNLLHAGIEDGVKWGGEPIDQYVDIVNETEIMREMGKAAYIQRCKDKIGKLKMGAR